MPDYNTLDGFLLVSFSIFMLSWLLTTVIIICDVE